MTDKDYLLHCLIDGATGFKWGVSGRCHTYDPGDPESIARAREAAQEDGRQVTERDRLVKGSKALPYQLG